MLQRLSGVSLVQDGAGWCRMVQDGAGWCRMVQDGAGWYRMVQDGAGSKKDEDQTRRRG